MYEIEPGHRLGWHTDATEETHYIIAGTGESHTEDGSSYPGRPWQYFCDSNAGKTHLVNVGKGNIARRCFLRGCVLLKTSAT